LKHPALAETEKLDPPNAGHFNMPTAVRQGVTMPQCLQLSVLRGRKLRSRVTQTAFVAI
jgi:hypothetical protein